MKQRIAGHLMFLLFFSLAMSVAPAQQPAQEPASATPSEGLPAEQTYHLQAGDSIEIRLFYNSELNEKVQIRPDGFISMGLIGQVLAANRTVPELTSELEKRYAPIVKNPSVLVQVIGFANRKAFVGGEVVRPGLINLIGEQTLLGAILEAGGATKAGNLNHVLLIRKSESGAPEVHRISLRADKQYASQGASFLLRPYDVILISEARISRINRAVDQYVFKMIPPQLTFGFTYLLNGGLIR
jgi:polysaccharide biosynthesis/export protein PslD